jgi:hypothetical protein
MAKASADRKIQKASRYDFDKGPRPKRVMGTLARRRLRARQSEALRRQLRTS